VAKEEGLRFIEKRANDAIGVVIFGNEAVSRCPLTVDKIMLRDILNEIDIGVINHEGTVLATSIITAASRLKSSTAKSKIMIVLTDGEPTPNDGDPGVAIEIAKSLGIKIYTIGIGDNQEVMINHPFYGAMPYKTTLNRSLLTRIAQETGGTFFEAKSADDMRTVYDTINTLETTKIEAPLFTRYYEMYIPWALGLLALLAAQGAVTASIWFGL
jgi:Ca-activated chloride channel family protein